MNGQGDRLGLGADELLSTTRAVRKRLDLERPVAPELIDECLELAVQAPTGSNAQGWHFLVVTDPDKRARLGELYRAGFELFYGDREAAEAGLADEDAEYAAATRRVIDSATHLAEHMGEVPVMVIPCVEGRTDGGNVMIQASVWGSLLPAVWSFMLAARERPRDVLDDAAPAARVGGSRAPRYPGERDAGSADPGRPHDRHRVQARSATGHGADRAPRLLVRGPAAAAEHSVHLFSNAGVRGGSQQRSCAAGPRPG
ncbi:MAG: nitroreductase family protein [Microthrixaceae bacterium]